MTGIALQTIGAIGGGLLTGTLLGGLLDKWGPGQWPLIGGLLKLGVTVISVLGIGKLLGGWLGQGKGDHAMAQPNNPGTTRIQPLDTPAEKKDDKKITSIERLQPHDGSLPATCLIGGTKEEKEAFDAVVNPEKNKAQIASQVGAANAVALKLCGTEASTAIDDELLPKELAARLLKTDNPIEIGRNLHIERGGDHANVLAKIGPDSHVPQFEYPTLRAG